MKNLEKLTSIIESIIFVSGSQIAIADICDKLEITEKELNSCIEELKKKYSSNSGIQLLCFNKKLQFCSNPENAEAVSTVLNPIKEKELSKSMLEAMAIIAYKQPVTRIDLEEIRGVSSEYCVQKLLELNLIEPVGRKDAVGKPVLFGTTDNFLKRFQISSLDELPDYDELINRIATLHVEEKQDDYLYKKDVYQEENQANTDENINESVSDNVQEEVAMTDTKEKRTDEKSNNDDFELPNLEDEELPDFLKNEKVDKI